MTVVSPIVQLHESEPRWFAIHTRSKCEKMVAQQLAKKAIIAYVPLVHSIRRYTRKVKKVEKPLITCYVFVRIVKNDYVSVLETENVAGFVKFSKNIFSIPEEEINILRRIVLEDGIELEAVQGHVQAGDPIVIKAGPLTGLSGTVVSVAGKRKVQVELVRLGYSLLMTVDPAFLEKMG